MKTSNKFAIVMAIVLIVIPCVSYALMNRKITATKNDLSQMVRKLTTEKVVKTNNDSCRSVVQSIEDNIKILHINGARTTKGLLSVSPVLPVRGNENQIHLNLEPSSMYMNKDTLFINIDDPGPIYQGFIRIRGLQTLILNHDTIDYDIRCKN